MIKIVRKALFIMKKALNCLQGLFDLYNAWFFPNSPDNYGDEMTKLFYCQFERSREPVVLC